MEPRAKRPRPQPEPPGRGDCPTLGVGEEISVEQLIGLWESLADPCRNLARSDVLQLQKLTEASKHFMKQTCECHLRRCNASGAPVLVFYNSDGTKITNIVTQTVRVGKIAFRRQGKKTEEHLIERFFLKSRGPDGRPIVTAMLRDPRPMSDGKTALHAFTARRDFVLDVESKTSGFVIHADVFDRALQSALQKLILKEHAERLEAPRIAFFAVLSPCTKIRFRDGWAQVYGFEQALLFFPSFFLWRWAG